jgi:hypothetical protein
VLIVVAWPWRFCPGELASIPLDSLFSTTQLRDYDNGCGRFVLVASLGDAAAAQ